MDPCSICHRRHADPPNNRTLTTPCNHTFHVACLRTWTQRSDTCPLCRRAGVKQNLNHQVFDKWTNHMVRLWNLVRRFESLSAPSKELFSLAHEIPHNVYVNRTWGTRANTNDSAETVNGVNAVIRIVLFLLLFNTERKFRIVLTIYIQIVRQIHKIERYAVHHGFVLPNTSFVDSVWFQGIRRYVDRFPNGRYRTVEYVVKSVDSLKKLLRETQWPTNQLSKKYRTKYPVSPLHRLPPTAYRTLFFLKANARPPQIPIPNPNFTQYKRLVKSLFQSVSSTATNRRVVNSVSKKLIVFRKQREASRRSPKHETKRRETNRNNISEGHSSSKRPRRIEYVYVNDT